MPAKKKKPTAKKKAVKKAPSKLNAVEPTKDEDFPEIKYKFGRPTKYQHKFCEYAIHYLSKGLSKEALAGVLCISKTTLYEWIKEHQDFANAIAIGEAKSQVHWEALTVEHVVHTKNGKQINGQVYGLNMKNRFGWSDKKEIALEEDTKKSFAFSLDKKPEDE